MKTALRASRRSTVSQRLKRVPVLSSTLFKIGMALDLTGADDLRTITELMTFDHNVLVKGIWRYVDNARSSAPRFYDTTNSQLVGSGPAVACVSGWNYLPLTSPIVLLAGRGYRVGFYTTGGNGQAHMGNHPNGGNVLSADGVTLTIDAFNGRHYSDNGVDGYPTNVWAGGNRTFAIQLEISKAFIYAFTGAPVNITVPTGSQSMIVDLYGAESGTANAALAGKGGRLQATLPVTAGETLQVNVGGKGPNPSGTPSAVGGGWNGGGTAGGAGGSVWGGPGGGATDIRRGAFALADRIAVAGGGGGSGATNTNTGAGGGGTTGATGPLGIAGAGSGGGGGTQTAGGSGGIGGAGAGAGSGGAFGVGGNGGTGGNRIGGGGGGGYYGGGGGGGNSGSGQAAGGGGGGSSYAVPTAVDVAHTQGVRSGDGLAVVTFSAEPALSLTTNPKIRLRADSLTGADASVVSSWVDSISAKSFVVGNGSPTLYKTTAARLINGKSTINFDGVDDILKSDATPLTADQSGYIIAVIRLISAPAVGSSEVVFGVTDVDVTNRHLLLMIRNEAGNARIGSAQLNADTSDSIEGSTNLTVGGLYILEMASVGAAYEMRVNNDLQTLNLLSGANTGDWIGDTSNADTITIGARKNSASESIHANIDVAEILVGGSVLSAGDRTAMYAYLSSRYGISL